MKAPILLTAGGTGGHVFPAEALAQELLARGHSLKFVTDTRGNSYAGTLGAIETFRVSSAQMLGHGPLDKMIGLFRLTQGVFQACSVLKQIRPSIVVGFGGYASVPAVGAALWLGIPIILHEQNAVLGRANRLFAKHVSRIATTFDETRHLPQGTRVERTGNPTRETILALRDIPYPLLSDTSPLSLLVLGGSQGARIFSEILPDAFRLLPQTIRSRLRISQQVRPEDMEQVQSAYSASGLDVTLKSFFDDVPSRLASCHLLISRSGASSLCEAAVAGRPSLLVPLPSAADDHQSVNARALETAGAAWTLSQPRITSKQMADILSSLLDSPESLIRAAKAARAWGIPDAARKLADLIEATLMDRERISQ